MERVIEVLENRNVILNYFNKVGGGRGVWLKFFFVLNFY